MSWLTAADVARWRALVLPTATCWVWCGAIGSDGYGRDWAIFAADATLTVASTAHEIGTGMPTIGRARSHGEGERSGTCAARRTNSDGATDRGGCHY